MFSKAIVILAALAGSVSAAPVKRDDVPANYASGYLEPYSTYHTRYLAIGCPSHKHGDSKDQFFTECCSPMLASQTLDTARAAWCIPSPAAIASVLTAPSGTDSAAASEYTQEATSVAAAVASVTATAESSLTAVTYVQESTTATIDVATSTSTYQAPAATSAAAPSSGTNSGQATFFYQNGNPGACGNYNSDSSSIVALPAQYWPSGGSSPSAYCGSQIEIFYNGESTIATVADMCPSCVGANSIDLSVGAFTALASESLGDLSVTWSFI